MQRIFLACAAILALFAFSVQAQNKYVGAKVCAFCHNTDKQGKVFDHWQQSQHSNAVRTLVKASESSSRKFQDFELWIVRMGRGEKYGLPKPAADSEYCLPCHSTAFGTPVQLIAPSFDPKDGVQCESCHGPGSAHVDVEIIKNSGKSIPAAEVPRALQIAKVADFKHFGDEYTIKARCSACHDGMCGDFDFAKMWPRIKHAVSKTK